MGRGAGGGSGLGLVTEELADGVGHPRAGQAEVLQQFVGQAGFAVAVLDAGVSGDRLALRTDPPVDPVLEEDHPSGS